MLITHKHTIISLQKQKEAGQKISCLTAYDSTMAAIISSCNIETILVGDSLGMVIQGNASTVPVTVEDIVYHTRCVARGNQGSFVISDMPFMSYANETQALSNAAKLMQAGAEMVKLEGGSWLCSTVRALVERGIPCCAHLGLQPQSINLLGGFRKQGLTSESATQIIEDAKALVNAGANLLVLECVPSILAGEITQIVKIPVIGIGAGNKTDGQVLVTQDMLGMTPQPMPSFAKNFMTQSSSVQEAIMLFKSEVKENIFPATHEALDSI